MGPDQDSQPQEPANPDIGGSGIPSTDNAHTIGMGAQYTVLEQCAEIAVLLWRYGIYVRCFSYADNNCVRADGRLVQLDFIESSFDTAWVSKSIEDAAWLDTWFVAHDLPADRRSDHRIPTDRERHCCRPQRSVVHAGDQTARAPSTERRARLEWRLDGPLTPASYALLPRRPQM